MAILDFQSTLLAKLSRTVAADASMYTYLGTGVRYGPYPVRGGFATRGQPGSRIVIILSIF